MSALGKLVASVVLDTAEFTQGTDKAGYEAAKLAGRVDKAMGDIERKAKASMAGVGAALAAGFSIAAISTWLEETAKANAQLDDMAEKTGATVEELSGLVNVAKVGGHDIGALEGAMAKLAKGMSGSELETKGAGKALAFLGISANDANGKMRNAADLTRDIAAKLVTYADGAGKAAIAQDLFGKSGAALLPYLNDLATSGDAVAKVTAKQAAEAEAYEKNLKRLAIAKGDLVRTVAQEVIPVINTMAEMYLKSKTASDSALASAQKLAGDGAIRDWAEKGAYSIAFMVDSANALITTIQAAGVAIAGDIRLAVELANVAANIANPLAAAEAARNMVTIYQDTEAQLQRVLAGHKSIRFELDAQLAKAREVDRLVAKYADDKYKDARDLRGRSSLNYRTTPAAAVVGNAAAVKSDLGDIDKLVDSLLAKGAGFESDFGEKMQRLWQGFMAGRVTLTDLTAAQAILIQQQPALKAAIEAEAKAREEAAAALRKYTEEQIRVNDGISQQIEQLQFSIDTFGLSRAATLEYAAAQLEAQAATLTLDEATEDQIRLLKERAALLRGQAGKTAELDALREQASMWGELSDRAGAFFGDLVVNGASAFDRLKQSLRGFAQEIIALFAKRYVLQMIAGVTGSTSMSVLASTAGNGSTAGSMLNILGSAGGVFGTSAAYAAAVPGLSSFGAGSQAAMLAAQTGEFGAAGLSATASAGGSGMLSTLATAAPYIAAIIAAYALIKKFGDKGENPKAQLGFGAGAQAYVTNGVFGAEGFKSIQTNDDFNQGLRAYMASFKGMDEALAKMLTDSQKERIAAALGSAGQREFAFPKGDGTAGEQLSLEYLKQKYSIVFGELDKKFADFVLGFTGKAEDLAKAIAEESAAIEMLTSDSTIDMLKRIPNLTIDGLRAMQAAGESLSQTFQRVVGEFLAAENNLNQAIGARNPQFARDLVLSQRNSVGVQFASSIGQSYGAGLATQMALNPQSFTGLNAEQMNLLANWLTLQTTLEQLDAQLANVSGPTGSLSNFGNALDSTASQMAGARLSLAGYLNGLNQSSLSPLTPTQKYIAAKQVFNQQAALAEGGNLDAIAGLSGYHQAFLTASQAVNASSGAYNADYFSSYARLNAVSGGQAQPLTSSVYSAGVQAMGTQIIALQASVQQITTTLQTIYNGPIPVEVVNGDDVGAPIAAALDPRAAGAPLG